MVPDLQSSADPIEDAAFQEALAALEAAWQRDTEMRLALHSAPRPVAEFFVAKRLLTSVGG
jgi:hypothetical protein